MYSDACLDVILILIHLFYSYSNRFSYNEILEKFTVVQGGYAVGVITPSDGVMNLESVLAFKKKSNFFKTLIQNKHSRKFALKPIRQTFSMVSAKGRF